MEGSMQPGSGGPEQGWSSRVGPAIPQNNKAARGQLGAGELRTLSRAHPAHDRSWTARARRRPTRSPLPHLQAARRAGRQQGRRRAGQTVSISAGQLARMQRLADGARQGNGAGSAGSRGLLEGKYMLPLASACCCTCCCLQSILFRAPKPSWGAIADDSTAAAAGCLCKRAPPRRRADAAGQASRSCPASARTQEGVQGC